MFSACAGEQAASHVLGYTSATWDNVSDEELQPWSTIKAWADLTANEKTAAGLLGYTETIWDNVSGTEPQPVSYYKHWSELTTCDDGEMPPVHTQCVVNLLSVLPVSLYATPEMANGPVCSLFFCSVRSHRIMGGIVD